jgi:hypothetical protein
MGYFSVPMQVMYCDLFRRLIMRDLVPELLPLLQNNRLGGLDAGPQAVYPFYGGYSLANLPASICHWLGIPVVGAPALAASILGLWGRHFQNVILLVIDGMGLDTFETALRRASEESSLSIWREMADGGPAAESALAPLTSTCPSTTSTVLTTLWTGCTPAQHGVLGYEMWLKEYNLIANMILHSPASFTSDPGSLRHAGFSPDTFLPVPVLGQHMAAHGIKPYAFLHHTIAHSGLSSMLLSGAETVPFRSLSDLWVTLDGLLEAKRAEQKYIYLYWADLDEHSHRFGPQDERVARELEVFSLQLGHFIRQQRLRGQGDTLLLITADHGHISTPLQPEYELRRHPDLMRCLAMSPSGEARLPLVFLRSGFETQFLDYLQAAWPEQFRAIPSEQALAAGLFGPGEIYARLADRAGNYVVIPQENAYWWFGARDNLLRGRHGGLTRTEMIVPLFSTAL